MQEKIVIEFLKFDFKKAYQKFESAFVYFSEKRNTIEAYFKEKELEDIWNDSFYQKEISRQDDNINITCIGQVLFISSYGLEIKAHVKSNFNFNLKLSLDGFYFISEFAMIYQSLELYDSYVHIDVNRLFIAYTLLPAPLKYYVTLPFNPSSIDKFYYAILKIYFEDLILINHENINSIKSLSIIKDEELSFNHYHLIGIEKEITLNKVLNYYHIN